MLHQLEKYILFITIIALTILIAQLYNLALKKWVKNFTSVLNNNPTHYLFFRKVVVAIIYILGFGFAIFTIPELKHLAGTLLAGAGVFAVAIGLASQQAFSNIVSGIFIVIFKPFKINDRIKVSTYEGTVEDITLRHTVIRNYENQRVVVPNSIIGDDFIVNSNYEDDKICKRIEIGIDYSSDIKLARKIIQEEVLNHPMHIDGRTELDMESGEDIVPVRVVDLGDSSVVLKFWAWADTPQNGFLMACDLKESIKIRFDNEGIIIPFPHRTIVHKNNFNHE